MSLIATPYLQCKGAEAGAPVSDMGDARAGETVGTCVWFRVHIGMIPSNLPQCARLHKCNIPAIKMLHERNETEITRA